MEPGSLIVLIALFAAFWLFVIKPQRKRMQAQRDLHASVAVGDEVVTVGGLMGYVRGVDDAEDVLHVELSPGTTVRVARRGVAAVLSPSDGPESGPDGSRPS